MDTTSSSIEECYQIAKETLEMMDKFAGSIGSKGKNLPSFLRFPKQLHPGIVNPEPLKIVNIQPPSQLFMPHTEKDNNPDIPHFPLKFEFMDFDIKAKPHSGSKNVDCSFDGAQKEDSKGEGVDDEEWISLSKRANLLKKPERSDPVPVQAQVPFNMRRAKEILAELKTRFGFKFFPNAEYKLSSSNPLFYDAIA